MEIQKSMERKRKTGMKRSLNGAMGSAQWERTLQHGQGPGFDSLELQQNQVRKKTKTKMMKGIKQRVMFSINV